MAFTFAGIRFGKNKTLVPAVQHSVTKKDILTADGKHIRQDALQAFMFCHAMHKAYDRLNKMIKEAVINGATTQGVLSACVNEGSGRAMWNEEKLYAHFTEYGLKADDFRTTSKPPVSLVVDYVSPLHLLDPATMKP